MVGRDEELGCIGRALADQRGGVVLYGAAGVGKTRLATEFLRLAAQRGYPTEWVVATEAAATIAFGAFAHLLDVADQPARSQLDVLSNAMAIVASRSRAATLVLGVDDAHLLDDASTALVHQVAQRRLAFVVAVVRTGEPPPAGVTSLWKDGHLARLDLPSLTREQVGELLASVLPGHVEGATVHRLVQLSHGNVLFLRELLEGSRTNGSLALVDGVWRLRRDAVPPLSLIELIEGRLAGLELLEREALEIAAFAEPIALAVLARIADAGALERLERHGLLTVSGEPPVARVVHPLFSDVLRRQIPSTRLREVRQRLVSGHRQIGSLKGHDLLRVAIWSVDSGTPVIGDVLMRAAEVAMKRFHLDLARRLAGEARRSGAGARAAVLEARAWWALGDGREADALLTSAWDAAESDADRSALTEIRARNLFTTLGRVEDARGLLKQAASETAGQRTDPTILCTRAALALDTGSVPEVLAVTDSLLATPRLPEHVAAEALHLRSAAHAMRGSIRLALTENERALELARTSDHPDLLIHVHSVRGRLLRLLDLDAAERHCEAQYRAAIRRPLPFGAAHLARTLGWVAMDRGLLRRAERWLSEASSGIGSTTEAFADARCLASIVQVAAMTGDRQRARTAWTGLQRAYSGTDRFFASEVFLAQAWVAAAEGNLRGARKIAFAAADDAGSYGNRHRELVALHDAARLGGGRRAARRLAGVVASVDYPVAPALADHAAALAAGDAGRLDDASHELQRHGFVLLAAEAACEAASAHRLSGRRKDALLSSARAQTLAGRCEDAHTPALRKLSARPVLSGRELEVARLAAAGLTSRQIAEHTGLSVRTVDNHLYRVYDKLEVSGRGELGPLLETE